MPEFSRQQGASKPSSVASSTGTQFDRGTETTSASCAEMAVANSYNTYCEVIDLSDDDLDLQNAIFQSSTSAAIIVEEEERFGLPS